jgi:hypothetical protein
MGGGQTDGHGLSYCTVSVTELGVGFTQAHFEDFGKET